MRQLCVRIGLFLAVVMSGVAYLQPSKTRAQSTIDPLVVVVDEAAPFVIGSGSKFDGFSIELWDLIADEIGREYLLVQVRTVDKMVAAVRDGEADVAIANIGITVERERRVDFSKPIYESGLQIVTLRNQSFRFLTQFASIFSPSVLGVLAMAFIVLNLVAHIMWFVERHENPEFKPGYLEGIQEAFYWAVVTASTVGYGDKVPRQFAGRMVAIIWMLLSLFLVSYFTATVTTSLTIDQLHGVINGPDQLRGHEVGTIVGSLADDYLTSRGIPFRSYANIDSGLAALTDGRLDAFVYDAAVLQYATSQSTESNNLRLVDNVFEPEDYGIVVAQGSILREDIDLALLLIKEDGRYEHLKRRWFGE